jgi:ribosomal protein S1
VVVTDVNSGGLLATLESLPAFLPYSLMAKNKEDAWMSIEVSAAASRSLHTWIRARF